MRVELDVESMLDQGVLKEMVEVAMKVETRATRAEMVKTEEKMKLTMAYRDGFGTSTT